VKEIANAVLYEGYLLYPYRQSAIKNRTRWTFGGVYPREYSEANGGIEPWTMRTECLVEGQPDSLSLDISVRFLHLLVRTVVQPQPAKDAHMEAIASEWEWGLASRLANEPLQEGVEREVSVSDLSLKNLLTSPQRVAIEFPATCTVEHPLKLPGIEITREQQAISGSFILSAGQVDTNLFKLSIEIENTTPETGTVTSEPGRPQGAALHIDLPANTMREQDRILLQSFISTHTILQVRQGSFISLLEPPEELQTFVKECQNIRTWPILVGNAGERNTMLSSPIILYDYPQIAPESPGPLFDGGEIDEILSLRILTLSDEEKEQMRQDERTREILERTEALTPAQFMKMHGTIRDLRPVSEGEQG
jgi:hydrogenase maturation protease